MDKSRIAPSKMPKWCNPARQAKTETDIENGRQLTLFSFESQNPSSTHFYPPIISFSGRAYALT